MCINVQNQEVFMVDDMGWLHIWSWMSERLVFAEQIVTQGNDPIYAVGCNNVGSSHRQRSEQSRFVTQGNDPNNAGMSHNGPEQCRY